MGVRKLIARVSYCVASLRAADLLRKCSAEFLECRELYLRSTIRRRKIHVHYKNILNSTGTSSSFFLVRMYRMEIRTGVTIYCLVASCPILTHLKKGQNNGC